MPEEIDDFDVWRAEEGAAADVLMDQIMEPAPDGVERRVVELPVEGGSVELHVFTPPTAGPHPAHLYLHGGGWIGGSIKHKSIDILCRERAAGADCVVVTVEYRKAPEHKFGAGLNDCYAALLWTAEHADELGVRTDSISIGGGSAGANLAAAVALKARDETGPALVLQLLEVPALDLTASTPSHQRNATGYGLTHDGIKACVRYYLDSPQDAHHPYASPLLAPDLSGLPPAYILSAEYDPVCDDGEEYARRLTEAGVPATFSLQRGQIHTSSALTKLLPAARSWREEALAALRDAHRPYPRTASAQ
ncbi:alpha/beta hydrolase [Nocardiopsis sp. NRRL B-16309]|uniref:alpha/beta hydrolase n=1 Tax=Nocardiopsis sp. NRRL B-16309 TaxID=1519494 RepID=UPI0018D018C3|nr:alpha/beta hydrolase [Nocardiopsis sp. NRRL B-16309]